VTISEARARGFSWPRIAELTASAPARLWHLAPRKGTIQVGADADLAFIDADRTWTVTNEDLLHAHQWSPFAGRELRGRVVRTMLRGTTIYDDDHPDRVQVAPGFGQFIAAAV
jgi:allantoinase